MAADPVFVNCPVGVWTKIADAVTVGQVHKVSENPQQYLQTYRLAGGVAPVLQSDGVKAFHDNKLYEKISSDAPIDVYIWTIGNAGRVRVDL